jgi:hypothetical protein
VGFALAAYILLQLISIPIIVAHVQWLILFAFGGVWILATFICGARIFRGATESRDPRPWWKMTSRPSLGVWLGILMSAISAFNCYAVAVGLEQVPQSPAVPNSGINAVVFTTLAALYFHSSFRLSRLASEQV